MILLTGYDSKKHLKECIGQSLQFQETSIFGAEYKSTGTIYGARRPHLLGGGREFFTKITMKDDLIVGVE
jgi:hypothetical protein|tara:strand:+ start:2001 stop:2210 length:210 start_codon:yes stop_codon:yes gene_type:complete